MQSFRNTLLSACMLATLAACTDSPSNPAQVTRSASSDFSHLPEPGTWSDRDIFAYFRSSPVSGRAHFSEHTVVGRLQARCGPVTRYKSFRRQHRVAIREYERQLATLPERSSCWAEHSDDVILARAAELSYLEPVADYATHVPQSVPLGDGPNRNVADVFHATRLINGNGGIDSEIDALTREMANFVLAPDRLKQMIAQEKGWRNENRASWTRAATTALNDFARDNPFSRPNPGQGLTSALTADVIGITDPGVVAALNAYDQTVMGNDAFVRAVLDRSTRYAAPSTAAARGGDAVNGPTLTLTSTPASQSDYEEQVRLARERDARTAATREEEYAAHLRQMRAVGERRAQERLDAKARSCGHASWAAFKALNAPVICQ